MIPALAFNDAKSHLVTDSITAGENLARAYRKLNEFSAIHCKREFKSKTSFIKINKLAISSASANGLLFETENYTKCILALSLVGSHTTTIGKVEYPYEADTTALFTSCEEKRTVSSGSGAAIHYQIEKLSSTYYAMSGSCREPLFLTNPKIMSVSVSGVSFIKLFKSLFSQIDMVDGDPIVLSKFALDDSFYRLCIGLLYPDLFLTSETRNGKRPYVRPEVNRLCEYIAAHLTQTISLTEMEAISGLSARILQRSFQNIFGLTPKQWLRKQRLHAARRAMLNRREPIAVTTLAYDFCFASPSDFAHHYTLEFGEQPSQTLRR